MMREIVIDSETTGTSNDDRIIEIGCVELVDLLPTGKTFHVYVSPQGRAVPPGAFRVHGLSNAFLKGKPPFRKIVDRFLTFVGDARLVAHNASFDTRMINLELARLNRPEVA